MSYYHIQNHTSSPSPPQHSPPFTPSSSPLAPHQTTALLSSTISDSNPARPTRARATSQTAFTTYANSRRPSLSYRRGSRGSMGNHASHVHPAHGYGSLAVRAVDSTNCDLSEHKEQYYNVEGCDGDWTTCGMDSPKRPRKGGFMSSGGSRTMGDGIGSLVALAGVLLLIGTGALWTMWPTDEFSELSTITTTATATAFANAPDFKFRNGYIQLLTLPFDLGPAPAPPSKQRRLIMVGDVHGALDELKTLLAKLDFDDKSGRDHLVLMGDLVAKGPKSGEVLDFMGSLMEEGTGSCVRGNHDDRVLRAYERIHRPVEQIVEEGEEEIAEGDEEDSEEIVEGEEVNAPDDEEEAEDDDNGTPLSQNKKKKHGKKHQRKRASDEAVAKTLTPSQAKVLNSCPLILRVHGAGQDGGDLLAVHAGILPGVPLMKQDPELLMNMRSIIMKKKQKGGKGKGGKGKGKEGKEDKDGRVAWGGGRGSSTSKGRHWAKVWNEYEDAKQQGKLIVGSEEEEGEGQDGWLEGERGVGKTVVYGHYAAKGLDIRKWSKGIDSNCVRGGHLTALVVERKVEEVEARKVDEQGKKGKGKNKRKIEMEVVSVKCRKYVD
ncbi:hypothetical protein BDZ91DRAFT_293441 [Kalaharituber pfeilii]|nr:hypothetical protein BDZ91DRAFT_293441 [Kalaharituber pfeilii]